MRPTTHAVIASVVLCCATVAYTYRTPDFGRFFSGLDDFLPRYTQARLVGSTQMYDIEAGYREQERAVGARIIGAYHDRLPWQALLMAPLGRLPYSQAHWIWASIALFCFGVLVRIWLVPRDTVLWGVTFLPAAASVIVGQDGLVLAACLAVAMRCADARRDFAAGTLLALCMAKPHLFFFIPIAFAVHRRWRVLKIAAGVTTLLLVCGTLAAGIDWPRRWWILIRTLGREADRGHNLAQCPSVFNLGMNAATFTLALAIVIGVVLLIWRSGTLDVGIALAVVGGILVAPHSAIYDLPLLLVAVPALPFDGWKRWLRIALLTPVPYWALLKGPPWNLTLAILLFVGLFASAWSVLKHDTAPAESNLRAAT